MKYTKCRLGDVAEIIMSSIDKKSKPHEKTVRLCNFTDVYHNWAITKDKYDSFMIATANDNAIEKLTLKKGYVAFTKDSETRDDIGIPTYIADDFDDVVLGYHCALVKPDEHKLSGEYLNAFMNSDYIKKYFELNATGSGMRFTLAIQTLEAMPLLLPELSEQKRIAKVLTDIDSKITVNKKINKELEAMAKGLYDYWFVQFDFPGANGKPYKSSGGKMSFNPLLKRNIPEGWEVKKLIDTANITMGQSPSGKTYNENGEGTVFYQGSTDFGERFPEIRMYTTEPTRFAKKDDILMSVRAPVGAINIAKEDCCIGRGLCAMNSKLGSNTFLEFVIRQLQEWFNNKGGTTFGAITKDEIHALPILVPDNIVMERFEQFCSPLRKLLYESNMEIIRLIKIRDELLPILMNGQVKVK